jgi:hypothetical protein
MSALLKALLQGFSPLIYMTLIPVSSRPYLPDNIYQTYQSLAIYPIFYLFHIVTSVVGPTAIAAAHLHFSLTIQQSDQRVAFKQPDLVKLATSWQLDPRN